MDVISVGRMHVLAGNDAVEKIFTHKGVQLPAILLWKPVITFLIFISDPIKSFDPNLCRNIQTASTGVLDDLWGVLQLLPIPTASKQNELSHTQHTHT